MENKLFDEKQMEETLKNFMLEQFDFDTLKKAGFYGKEIKRNDYKAQAARVCWFFGFETVFEYGAKDIRCHITYASGVAGLDSKRPPNEPFVTIIKGWFDEYRREA
jgi:hypothetical protein